MKCSGPVQQSRMVNVVNLHALNFCKVACLALCLQPPASLSHHEHNPPTVSADPLWPPWRHNWIFVLGCFLSLGFRRPNTTSSLIWSDLMVCHTATLPQRITSVIEGKIGVDSESLGCKLILPSALRQSTSSLSVVSCAACTSLVWFLLFDPLKGFFSLSKMHVWQQGICIAQ